MQSGRNEISYWYSIKPKKCERVFLFMLGVPCAASWNFVFVYDFGYCPMGGKLS